MKKHNIYILLIIVILSGGIIILSKNISNIESKEVKAAKSFIELLINKEIIDKDAEKLLDQDYINKSIEKVSNIKHSVILGSYAIDIDKDLKVIGFSNKNLDSRIREINIKEEEAIALAEKYLKEIIDSEFLFKEIKERNEENDSHYNVVFYKAKDGYPIYSQEITMIIDKRTGKLNFYSNNNPDITKYNNNINLNESEIKIKMDKYFLEIEKEVSYISNGSLAYVNSDGEYILSYIFNIIIEPSEEIITINDTSEITYDYKEENKDSDDKSKKEEIVIIRGDNGEFINLDTSLINN